MTSALSMKRKAEEEPQSMTRGRTFPTTVVAHGVFGILFIAWEDHDHDRENFQREINNVMALADHLGAAKSEMHWIPSRLTGRAIGKNVRDAIEDFKEECLAINAHELIIYSGHGGEGESGQLIMSGGGSRGQSMEWKARQFCTALSGPMATLLLMDCCVSGLAFKGPAQPCKLIFAACAGTMGEESTPGPGGDSFSSLLVLAGWSFEEPFTWQEWIDKTAELAEEHDCQVPVWGTFGGNDQILFKPRPWVVAEKKRAEKKQAEQKQAEQEQAIQASNPPTLLERLKRMKFGRPPGEYC